MGVIGLIYWEECAVGLICRSSLMFTNPFLGDHLNFSDTSFLRKSRIRNSPFSAANLVSALMEVTRTTHLDVFGKSLYSYKCLFCAILLFCIPKRKHKKLTNCREKQNKYIILYYLISFLINIFYEESKCDEHNMLFLLYFCHLFCLFYSQIEIDDDEFLWISSSELCLIWVKPILNILNSSSSDWNHHQV